MLKGTMNEDCVLSALKRIQLVKGVHEVGLI